MLYTNLSTYRLHVETKYAHHYICINQKYISASTICTCKIYVRKPILFQRRNLFNKERRTIGLKSDHDMVLLDTSIQPVRTRLPRRKIYIWKKANVDGIRSLFRTFAGQFCTSSAQSVEDIWTTFKSPISSAVSQHVPSKMSSTRQTHPWVDTKLRRHMRRKQRAHQKAKKSRKDKDWKRYKKLQKEVQSSTRKAEKDFLQIVISGKLKQDPKHFFSYVKSRKQDYVGVSSLVDKTATSLVIQQREPTS